MTLGRNCQPACTTTSTATTISRTYEPRNGWDEFGELRREIRGQFTGTADRWHDHYAESYTLKGSYSFMGAGNNKFKTGLRAVSFTEMQLIDLQTDLGNPPAGKLGIGAGHLRGPSRHRRRRTSRTPSSTAA